MTPIEENKGFYLIEVAVKVAVPLTEAEEVVSRNQSVTVGNITYLKFVGTVADMASYEHTIPNVMRAINYALPDRDNNYAFAMAFEAVNDAAILHLMSRRPEYQKAVEEGKVDAGKWQV